MRRRKLLLVLAGLAAAVCVAGAVVVWPLVHPITQVNSYRIRERMALAEVEAILGPPGDYCTGPLRTDWNPNWTVPDDMAAEPYKRWATNIKDVYYRGCWCRDTRVVCLFLNSNSMVYWVQDSCIARVNQSPVDNLLWRINRPWHRWFP
jgi:hypothetical protein